MPFMHNVTDYGLFQWLPLHLAGRSAVLEKGNEYELRSVMTAGLVIGFWDEKKGESAQDAANLLEQYHSIQKYFYGRYYPLTPYSQDNSVWIGWQFDLPEEGEGMVQAFRREKSVYESSRFTLTGFYWNRMFSILSPTSIQAVRRRLLAVSFTEKGLLVNIAERPGSSISIYKKVE